MEVRVIDTFGSDEKISRMARISYGSLEPKEGAELKQFILKLLRDGHLVPFEHCAITYYLEVPIYVARQLVRYRTAVISERSLRYSEAASAEDELTRPIINEAYAAAFAQYSNLVKNGVPYEEARSILPLATPTAMYYTMNLRNLMHLFDQRISDHAQRETRQAAERMLMYARGWFPATFGAYSALRSR